MDEQVHLTKPDSGISYHISLICYEHQGHSPQVWQRWKAAKQLALLATFEDSVTGMRVKEFCQGLSRNLGQQCQIIEHVWLFSTFRLRELQEIAAEEASASDLVIISVHQAEGLPDEVKSWIDLWLSNKGARPAVLLALLEPGL